MGFSLQYTDTVTGQLCEAKNVELKGSIKSCSVVQLSSSGILRRLTIDYSMGYDGT